MWKVLSIFAILWSITACSSLPENLQQVRAGMDKDQVLQIAGNPKFTFRENSQDHWAYLYFSNNQEWRRDIVFENGKVIRVTKPVTKEKWQKALDGASTMEEFEQIARERQVLSEKFVDLDGSP